MTMRLSPDARDVDLHRTDLAARAAVTLDAHQELTNAVIKPLDVGQHAHRPMVLMSIMGVRRAISCECPVAVSTPSVFPPAGALLLSA